MSNNPTKNRKPSNNMAPGAGEPKLGRPVREGTDVESMASSGMAGVGYTRSRDTKTYANPYSIGDRAHSQNVGRGPTKGNASSSSIMKGIDHKMTIATAAGGGPIVGRAEVKSPSNPTKINMGLGPRKGNAT